MWSLDESTMWFQVQFQSNEEVIGDDYISKDEIHDRVRTNIYEANDWMEEYYDIKADEDG